MTDTTRRTRNLSVALIALIVLLAGLNIWQSQLYRLDSDRRDSQRSQILEKLDASQQSILCYTETQSKWDTAVSDLLRANVTPDPGDDITIDALARLEAVSQHLDAIVNQCFTDQEAAGG